MLFREGIYTVLSRIVVLFLGLAGSVLLNRLLGPYGKGIYTGIIVFVSTSAAFFFIGFDIVSSTLIGKRGWKPGRVTATYLLIFLCETLIFGLVVFFSRSILLKGMPYMFFIPVICVLFFSELWIRFLPDIFIGMGNIAGFNRFQIISAGLKVFILMAFLFSKRGEPWIAVLAVLTHGILIFLFSLFMFKPEGIDLKGVFHEIVHTGIWIYLADLFSFLLYRFDFLLVRVLSGPEALGYYSTSVYLAEVFWIVPVGFYHVVYSKEITGKRTEFKKFIPPKIPLLMVLFLLGYFLVKPVVILLYGRDFLPAVIPFRFLLPGVFAYFYPKFMNAIVVARFSKPWIIAIASGMAFIINIVLDVVLIPIYGVNGAAISSTVCYIGGAVLYWILLKKVVYGRNGSFHGL